MLLKTPTRYVALHPAAVARILTIDVAGYKARSYIREGMGSARCSPNGKCHRSNRRLVQSHLTLCMTITGEPEHSSGSNQRSEKSSLHTTSRAWVHASYPKAKGGVRGAT